MGTNALNKTQEEIALDIIGSIVDLFNALKGALIGRSELGYPIDSNGDGTPPDIGTQTYPFESIFVNNIVTRDGVLPVTLLREIAVQGQRYTPFLYGYSAAEQTYTWSHTIADACEIEAFSSGGGSAGGGGGGGFEASGQAGGTPGEDTNDASVGNDSRIKIGRGASTLTLTIEGGDAGKGARGGREYDSDVDDVVPLFDGSNGQPGSPGRSGGDDGGYTVPSSGNAIPGLSFEYFYKDSNISSGGKSGEGAAQNGFKYGGSGGIGGGGVRDHYVIHIIGLEEGDEIVFLTGTGGAGSAGGDGGASAFSPPPNVGTEAGDGGGGKGGAPGAFYLVPLLRPDSVSD